MQERNHFMPCCRGSSHEPSTNKPTRTCNENLHGDQTISPTKCWALRMLR